MSNGDDVLDNWEEIDEAKLTSKLQQLEKECKTKNDTILEEIETFSTIAARESIGSTAKTLTTSSSAPGTMKLLQRATQNKILPGSSAVTTSSQSMDSAANENVSSPLNDLNSAFQPVLMVLHKDADEYQSANYAQPINTQTVKILRRPTQSSEPRNNGVRPKQPIKTLQQREQEYAEARLRILGAAKNPEDDTTANVSPTTSTSSNTASTTTNTTAANTTMLLSTQTNNIQAKTNASVSRNQQQQQQPQPPQQQCFPTPQSAYNNYYQQQQQNLYFQKQQPQQPQQLHHSLSSPAFGNNRLQFANSGLLPTPPVVAQNLQQRQQFQQLQQLQHYHSQQQQPTQQQQSWSPVVGGSVSSYTLQRQQQRQQQQQQQQQQPQQTDILRSPRGPDGSTGFQMRR